MGGGNITDHFQVLYVKIKCTFVCLSVWWCVRRTWRDGFPLPVFIGQEFRTSDLRVRYLWDLCIGGECGAWGHTQVLEVVREAVQTVEKPMPEDTQNAQGKQWYL